MASRFFRVFTFALGPSGGLAVAVVAAGLLGAQPASAGDTSLKETMKQMQAILTKGEDVKGLAPLFDATKAKGKPEFAQWAAISDQGKAAATANKLDDAKKTCKACHDPYRSDYKNKYGSRAP